LPTKSVHPPISPLLLFLAALAAAALVVLPPAPAAALSVDTDTFTLPNGMTVVFYPDHTLPKVVVDTWFHVGSKDEKPGRSGFAHLFEHLMFTGTDRAPNYDTPIEAGGGWSNASTGSDRTNFFDSGPSSLLPTFLWLEADRLDDLAKAMTQKKLDTQRDVVLNERRETENAPYGRADLLVSELMYPKDHPYHNPVIGSHVDLGAATLEDVKAFFGTYYVPGNATVVIAGDFDPAEVRPIVEKTYGVLPATSTPEHRTAEPVELTEEVRHVETDHVQFPRLSLVWHSPPYFRDGDGEMDLTAEILAGGSASRLEKKLVLDERVAQSVAAYQESEELGSLFHIETTAAPGADLDTIKRMILDELATYTEDGPTDAELARAKAQNEAGFLRRMESLVSRADRINAYMQYYGTPDGFDRDLARWTKPTREDVRTWAQRVFGPGRLDLRVYPETPPDAAKALDERPQNFAPASFVPPTPQTFRLSNGVEVAVLPRAGTQLFTGRLIAAAGENEVPADRAGLAGLAASVMSSGAGGKHAAEFADAVESLGASVWVTANGAATTAGVSGLSSRLEKTLDLFADLVLRPNLEKTDFDRERTLAIAAIRSRSDDAEALSRMVGRALLFADDDPRHRPLDGTEATVSAITLDDVRAHLASVFQPARAKMVFAGDFDVATLQKALESRFRRWKDEGAAVAPVAVHPRSGTARFVLVDRPDAPQTVVYATRLVPRQEGRERAVRTAASIVFGGSFTSRVNTDLREKNSYTYGAFGHVVDAPDYTFLFVTSDVFTNVTGKALSAMKNECNGMASSPPTDEEVTKAVESGRADLVDTASTTHSLGGTLAQLVADGRPLDSVARDMEELGRIDADAVRAFARDGMWNWSGLNVVLVGDRKTVLPQLAEAGFPAPEIVDELGNPVAEAVESR
jgi:zinc protease